MEFSPICSLQIFSKNGLSLCCIVLYCIVLNLCASKIKYLPRIHLHVALSYIRLCPQLLYFGGNLIYLPESKYQVYVVIILRLGNLGVLGTDVGNVWWMLGMFQWTFYFDVMQTVFFNIVDNMIHMIPKQMFLSSTRT